MRYGNYRMFGSCIRFHIWWYWHLSDRPRNRWGNDFLPWLLWWLPSLIAVMTTMNLTRDRKLSVEQYLYSGTRYPCFLNQVLAFQFPGFVAKRLTEWRNIYYVTINVTFPLYCTFCPWNSYGFFYLKTIQQTYKAIKLVHSWYMFFCKCSMNSYITNSKLPRT